MRQVRSIWIIELCIQSQKLTQEKITWDPLQHSYPAVFGWTVSTEKFSERQKKRRDKSGICLGTEYLWSFPGNLHARPLVVSDASTERTCVLRPGTN